MKTILPILYTVLFCSFGNQLLAQQVPYRSAFGGNDFQYNPAMTAPGDYLNFGATYRQQWLGFDEAPSTASVFVEIPFVKNNMSMGGAINRDEAGPLIRNDISLHYSYKIGLKGDGQLSLGVLANIGQFRFDGTNVTAADPDDELLLLGRSTSVIPNFGFGAFYVSNTGMYDLSENAFYFGIGSNQLLPSKLQFDDNNFTNLKRAIHANAFLGGRIINDFGYIEPSVWLNYSSENIIHGTANILFEMEDAFWAGFSLSSDLLVGLQAGVTLSDGWLKDGQLRIGILGAYSIGTISTQQGLGFECLLAYRFDL